MKLSENFLLDWSEFTNRTEMEKFQKNYSESKFNLDFFVQGKQREKR